MLGITKDRQRALMPIDEFEAMGRRLDKWVDSVFNGWPAVSAQALQRFTGPTLDVQDLGNQFLVKADIPGMKKEDIKISVNGSVLVIEGQRESEEEEKKKGYYRSERYFGEFRRVLDLPAEVDQTKAEAKYADGVLTLTLPKLAPKPQSNGNIKIH